MMVNPLSDVISSQYARWMFPQPILDLRSWLIDNWQWFDPSHAHRMLWPDRDYKPDMDILIAGCGTNQAAVFAYTNPGARVVAIDVSQPSLDHHQFLKDKYGMKNLELHLLPIEDLQMLKRDFDLIVSTGVLHHLVEPRKGMEALARCLRQEGVAAIMLYAKYGRVGVEMLQSVFRDLGLPQNDASVVMVKEALAALPQGHPVVSYMALAHDLQFDAGLVDTFLNGRDRSYTIDDCIDLVTSAGLVFQDLFLKAPYYPPPYSASAFHSFVSNLPESKQWSIMERINFPNGCHFFTACRADRPCASYKIDFGSENSFDYVPSLRHRCSLRGNQLSQYDWSMTLDPFQLALVQQVDGRRTISEILAEASWNGVSAQQGQAEGEKLARTLFQTLWRLDFLAICLKSGSPVTAAALA